MINSEDFTKRLQKVMDYYGESASSFSDKIGVQRSSISHILSGRNKPSLDFVLKVLSAFPEVELYWLLNGKGNFPHNSEEKIADAPPASQVKKVENVLPEGSTEKKIERIVIFYKDGTFGEYHPTN